MTSTYFSFCVCSDMWLVCFTGLSSEHRVGSRKEQRAKMQKYSFSSTFRVYAWCRHCSGLLAYKPLNKTDKDACTSVAHVLEEGG